MLYPCSFALGAGIFVGAIWANISWGRYWGWDPKEVWALISFIIVSLALHDRIFACFRRSFCLHSYIFLIFAAIMMTYFGVNYFLGGIHSYSGSHFNTNVLIYIILIVFLLTFLIVSAHLKLKFKKNKK
jgi:cytochrome c biogenesis factor